MTRAMNRIVVAVSVVAIWLTGIGLGASSAQAAPSTATVATQESKPDPGWWSGTAPYCWWERVVSYRYVNGSWVPHVWWGRTCRSYL